MNKYILSDAIKYIEIYYDKTERVLARIIFSNLLSRITENRLELITKARASIKISIIISIVMIIYSIIYLNAKTLIISGMLIDVAGLARIFIDDEWSDILMLYTDEEKYPYGPPSHIMRELTEDNDIDLFDDNEKETETMARFMYWKRGLVMIFIGFLIQMTGTILQ